MMYRARLCRVLASDLDESHWYGINLDKDTLEVDTNDIPE